MKRRRRRLLEAKGAESVARKAMETMRQRLVYDPAQAAANEGKYAAVAEIFNRFLAVEPDSVDAMHMQSVASLALGDREQYIKIWDRAFSLAKNGPKDAELGSILASRITAGSDQKLSDQIQKLAESAGERGVVFPSLIGAALFRSGRYREAVEKLDTEFLQIRDDAWGYLFLALASEKSGDRVAAIKAYRNAESAIETPTRRNPGAPGTSGLK